MTASRSQWEAIKEGVGKGAAKSASDWIETLFGLKPDKFVEHVAIEVVAALIVAAILGLIGFFARRPIWHLLRRTWIAATFKKRWLERVDADIIIWGKRTKGHSIGMIRLIGKDRAKGVIEVLRVDFDKTARDFDDALSTAVAYEAARLTQVTLSEPRLASLNVL